MKKVFLAGLATLALTFIASISFASPIEVDGILSVGEYTGTHSGQKELLWWNGHKSIYTKDAGHKNDLYWEINETVTDWSLNFFFEVPTYARRMIWGAGIEYDGTNYDGAWGIPEEYLDAYLTGAKDVQSDGETHHNSVKMDYETQTGSEYFQLNDKDGIFKKITWQEEDDNGLTDGFTWKTSREYLITAGLCDTIECLKFNRTMSIEMMWLGFDSYEDALAIKDSITDMELHLSDEARGLPGIPDIPSNPVPEPTTMLLFGLGILGLAGVSRRKK